MADLKNKQCEGFDRIPLCLFVDAAEMLLPPCPPFLVRST